MNNSVAVELRKAEPGDSIEIALAVISGMGREVYLPVSAGGTEPSEDMKLVRILTEVAARPDTLYSWKNAYVATCNGDVAGVLVSYDGAEYKEKSKLTFGIVAEGLGLESLNPCGVETVAGEYYLDSLAVRPEYRGHGISHLLVRNSIEVAEALGFELVTLIVGRNKPWLQRLYGRLGFSVDGEMTFFGEEFYRMSQRLV